MWDLVLNDEQTAITDAVNQFLQGEFPLARLRPNARVRHRAADHAAMAEQGWIGLSIAEAAGGLGLTIADEMLIQRACGLHLASTSVLASVLAAHAAHDAEDLELCGALIAGRRKAALTIQVKAADSKGQFPVLAFDWEPGDLLLTWNEHGLGLFEPTAFIEAATEESLDDSLTLHRGLLDRSRALHWLTDEASSLRLRAECLLAARLSGLAEGACQLARDYALQREQFGRPIGAFQAIKHRCADMAVRAMTAGDLVWLACLKLHAGSPDRELAVASAKLKAAHAAHENGRAVIQIHGGLGFQSECDAHWYMKRPHVYSQAGWNMQSLGQRIYLSTESIW
jgi:alkylation response protein AidB-like acyl-CoA dehydrogenase